MDSLESKGYKEIAYRWNLEAKVEAVYHEAPARYLRLDRSDTEGDSDDALLAIEEATYSEWDNSVLEDRTDLAREPGTSRRAGHPRHIRRVTKRKLLAGCMNAEQVWTKCLVPASSLPELLAQRQEMHQRMKEITSRSEPKSRWHRAFEMAMEGHEVDRALRNVRDISNRIRQYMFFSESQNSVLKLSSMLNQYDKIYERKRFSRLTGLSDLSRLAYPIEQLIDARTFECHEVVQQELGTAVQNEVSRRAEPMELQRWERETDSALQQSEVGRRGVNKKLDDLQHSIHRTAHKASTFIKNVKKTLQIVISDISEFSKTHANLKKADKDYHADLFDQQRRNDGYQDALEKLTARRKLAEGRLQADLETLRSEHAILKRSLETQEKVHEESKTRASEMASWLQVLSGQRLEKSADLMLEVHEERMHRRRALFKRINWLELQHLKVKLAKLRDSLRSSTQALNQRRLEKDVEQYRAIAGDSKVLLLELRGRCQELNVDGTLKDLGKGVDVDGASSAERFFDVLSKELNAQADWLRGRYMDVRFSTGTFTLARRVRRSTPVSLLGVADRLLHQRQLKMMVVREMRRASMGMEEKVEQLTQRFKLALVSRRHSHKEDDAASSGEDSSDEWEDEIECMSEGIDNQTLRQKMCEHSEGMDGIERTETTSAAVSRNPTSVEVEAGRAHSREGSVSAATLQLRQPSFFEESPTPRAGTSASQVSRTRTFTGTREKDAGSPGDEGLEKDEIERIEGVDTETLQQIVADAEVMEDIERIGTIAEAEGGHAYSRQGSVAAAAQRQLSSSKEPHLRRELLKQMSSAEAGHAHGRAGSVAMQVQRLSSMEESTTPRAGALASKAAWSLQLTKEWEEKMPKSQTEQEMVAVYMMRVAMRSLWIIQGQKLLQAQKAAQIYCKQLLGRFEVPHVAFDGKLECFPDKPGGAAATGKAASKKRGSVRRSVVATKSKIGSKASTSSTPSANPKSRSSLRGSLKTGLRASLKHPVTPARSEGQNLFVGQATSKATQIPKGQKLNRDAQGRVSANRGSRASIESKPDAAALMESVTIGHAREMVPVISVRPASPQSSAHGSSSSSSATESAAESANEANERAMTHVQRRLNVMTDLLETKALRNQVQASLGEEELEKSNQWAEDWIRRKSMQEGGDQELNELDGRHLLRRTGLATITPVEADVALGLEGPAELTDDSSDEELLQRDFETVEHFIQSFAAATVKQKQAGLRIPGREAVRLSMTMKAPPILFSKDSRRAKGPSPSSKSASRKKQGPSKSFSRDGQEDAVSPGFLADPLVRKLQRETAAHRSMTGHSPKSSRREMSTSTTREPGDPEGLQEDSFMALSSVQSTEKYSYLSQRAISEAVRDDPRARRSQKGAVLPKLVAVRMDGPGDAEASQYADKGRKGALSAAMAQAARMQPGKASSRPNSKQEVRVRLEAKKIDAPDSMSLDDYVGLSQDGSAVRFLQEAAPEEEALGLSVPQIRAQPAGRSAGDASDPPSPSSGWSHGHQSEVAARSSRTAGSVLTTRPRECKPMLSARAKKYFNGASLR